jgi:hypothetical protein
LPRPEVKRRTNDDGDEDRCRDQKITARREIRRFAPRAPKNVSGLAGGANRIGFGDFFAFERGEKCRHQIVLRRERLEFPDGAVLVAALEKLSRRGDGRLRGGVALRARGRLFDRLLRALLQILRRGIVWIDRQHFAGGANRRFVAALGEARPRAAHRFLQLTRALDFATGGVDRLLDLLDVR